MFVHMSVHSPKDAYREHLRDSMHRFRGAIEQVDGFIDGGVFEDEKTGRLIGMIRWRSREDMEQNIHLAAEAVQHDDFDTWEHNPPESFLLGEM